MRVLPILLLSLAPGLAEAQHAAAAPLAEGGQAAFAALAEIVKRLDADPATDWTRTDLPALTAHLADMDRVFTRAGVVRSDTEAGADFVVTGAPEVAASARRMASAYGATLPPGWRWDATEIPDGVAVSVAAPDAGRARLRGLGFLGLLADGDHHRAHHWALATGAAPHHP